MAASSSKQIEDAELQEALQQSLSTYLEEEERQMVQAQDESNLQYDYESDHSRARKESKEEEIVRAKDESMLRQDEESDRSRALEKSKDEHEAVDHARAIRESTRDHEQRLSIARTQRQMRDRHIPVITLELVDPSRRERRDVPCPSVRMEIDRANPTGRYFLKSQHPILFTELHSIRYLLREDNDWHQIAVANVPIMDMVHAITGSIEARVHYLSNPNSDEEVTIPRAVAFRPMLIGEIASLVGGWDNVRLILERD